MKFFYSILFIAMSTAFIEATTFTCPNTLVTVSSHDSSTNTITYQANQELVNCNRSDNQANVTLTIIDGQSQYTESTNTGSSNSCLVTGNNEADCVPFNSADLTLNLIFRVTTTISGQDIIDEYTIPVRETMSSSSFSEFTGTTIPCGSSEINNSISIYNWDLYKESIITDHQIISYIDFSTFNQKIAICPRS